VTFIKIRSHRRKFSNSDSVEQKLILNNENWKSCVCFHSIREIISRISLVQNFNIGKFFANELKHPLIIRSGDQLLSNKSPRLRLVLLFDNNWSSDLIYGCFRSLVKTFPIKNFALGI
jgi:hypothetical protein